MPLPTAVTSAFLDKVLTQLAPLFLVATGGDMEAARETVRATLASYQVRNDNELRLASLVVAFGFGALDALSKAANKALSLDEVMDLRDNANALSLAGDKSQAMLDSLLKRRSTAVAPRRKTLPASMEPTDLVAFARSSTSAETVAPSGRSRTVAKTSVRRQDDRGQSDSLDGRTTLH